MDYHHHPRGAAREEEERKKKKKKKKQYMNRRTKGEMEMMGRKGMERDYDYIGLYMCQCIRNPIAFSSQLKKKDEGRYRDIV